MIISTIFRDTNPETNLKLKALYSDLIFVEKIKTNIGTEYIFASNQESKKNYFINLKEDEELQSLMQEKYGFANEQYVL